MMKLYYFDPDCYGETYYVAAPTKYEALLYLLKFLEERIPKDRLLGGKHNYEYSQWFNWKDATVEDLPCGYSIEEYEVGQVVQGEIC